VRAQLAASRLEHLRRLGEVFEHGIHELTQAVRSIIAVARKEPQRALAGGQPLLLLFGTVSGGWQLARAALAAERLLNAGGPEREFYESKIITARFYGDQILPRAAAFKCAAIEGAEVVLAMDEDQF